MGRDKYRRKTAALSVRNKVLIICSGETEERYFNYFKSKYKKELSNITVKVHRHKKSDPMSVVKEALAHKAEYNEVWAVFDKDDFDCFDDAIMFGIKSDVNCAFSNEAIEYWFLLHFENLTGAISRPVLNSELGKKLGFPYKKDAGGIDTISKIIIKDLMTAEERARIGHERHIRDSGLNPSDWRSCTTIYALTKRLREWSKANK